MKKEETVDYHIKALWHAIARMYNLHAAKYDSTYTIGYVLLNIEHEGTLATKVAPKLGLEPRSLTRILKSMEDLGLIYRETDQHDRRKVWIKLTDEGRHKRQFSREAVLGFNTTVYEKIPEKKLQTFFEVMNAIRHIINDQMYHIKEQKLVDEKAYS